MCNLYREVWDTRMQASSHERLTFSFVTARVRRCSQMKADTSPLLARASHGKPLLGTDVDPVAGATALEGVGACGGGAAAAAGKSEANSANCESGCQFAMPSFQPRSLERKRPLRIPSRTCSSGNAPRLVAPRLT